MGKRREDILGGGNNLSKIIGIGRYMDFLDREGYDLFRGGGGI